ncbi:MAG: hypothetical protein JXI43_05790, partial [Tissierellales bacterium]|nr:hypothetical protein [Tissierellales bacterium]
EVIHVVVNSCFNLNELMSMDFEGRSSVQKPANLNKKNAGEVSGKVKKVSGKILQGELFQSRDFK